MVYMDENGDAEGNYTLLARKRHLMFPQEYGLYPVGVFTLKENDNKILVSKSGPYASFHGKMITKESTN
jgi:atrial natriuretic peptide receptor A